eukprot:7295132-Lingulodinium_polyedra.AAC.1
MAAGGGSGGARPGAGDAFCCLAWPASWSSVVTTATIGSRAPESSPCARARAASVSGSRPA